VNKEFRVTSYELRVTGYELRVKAQRRKNKNLATDKARIIPGLESAEDIARIKNRGKRQERISTK